MAPLMQNPFLAKNSLCQLLFLYNGRIGGSIVHLLRQQKAPLMKKGIRQIDPAYPVFVDAVMDMASYKDIFMSMMKCIRLFIFSKLHAAFIMLQEEVKRGCYAAQPSLWMCTKGRKDKTADLPYFQQIH